MHRRQATLIALAALLLAAPALAGCLGSDGGQSAGAASQDDAGSSSGSGASDGTVEKRAGNATVESGKPDDWKTVKRTVVAKDVVNHDPPRNYTYDVEGSDDKTITVPVNSTVKLTLVNHQRSLWEHDVKIKGLVDSDVIAPGESLTVTFNVTEPGPTPYWCTVGDHRERGMEGIFVVQPRSA